MTRSSFWARAGGWLAVVPATLAGSPLIADGPADNIPGTVRPVPPPGVAIPEADRAELERGAEALGREIGAVETELRGKPDLLSLLPDVRIFHKAVDWALRYNEFFNLREVPVAREMLRRGMERAGDLRRGEAPWAVQTGLVVRGYTSKIDGSVQPYGLVIPESYSPKNPRKRRLDLWFHGRGEQLSELNFLNDRSRNQGEFAPPDTFVLHLYGRYCNANKLAGEEDLFEALEDVKRRYPIDEDRIVARGFSMGGAACWQFAVHFPGEFAAAAPGAGFSETPDFLKVFQKETVQPTSWEQKLWHMYDCPGYAANLFNLPVVAYSGENDIQKQAADIMETALRREGIALVHLIGPKTGHSYHPETRREIDRRIGAIAERGRVRVPERIRFVTYTLRYNKCRWLEIDRLGAHWEEARAGARLARPWEFALTLKNVRGFVIRFGPGECPWPAASTCRVRVEDRSTGQTQELKAAGPKSDRSLFIRCKRLGRTWRVVSEDADRQTIEKRPGLQGPIDDAFLDRFLMVAPTGEAANSKIGEWARNEMAHALDHWRKQFRGIAPMKQDNEVTEEDIASSNLVLWGDPKSNAILAKVADRLPVRWSAEAIRVGGKRFPSATSVPILICPNPLNPKRYVVLNSGFTFREYDYLNNARQVPKLPDWAIVDTTTPPNSRYPGKVLEAGFFDEEWKVK